jgi:putative ubiquitin-RnfH superfamily antitoxin RatB of RatAB toxin-antitoxin module
LDIFPEIDADSDKMGIFSQVLGTKGLEEPAVYQLQPMDRVEIYRPLIADPKEVRRRRAAEAAAKKSD